MPEIFLNIAGIRLKIKGDATPLGLNNLKSFSHSTHKPAKGLWYLEVDEKPKKKINSQLLIYAYAQLLALHKGLLLHCTAVVKNKKAYLFFGASGEGKTTVALLCRHYQVLGDDIIALKKNSAQYRAFATPWKQRSFIQPQPKLSAPVEAIFFLKKSKKIIFKAIKKEEALMRILSRHIHFLSCTERPLLDNLFFTCAGFVKTVPAYTMEFRKDKNFWPALEKCT